MFNHLHVHSQYSFLDGASTLDSLLKKTKSLGMKALAITDHNRLTGAIRFYDRANTLGIKPIIGMEVTLEGDFHLTLLCKNSDGYSNLCRLITEANLNSPHGKPTLRKNTLAEYNQGLVCLSGCSKGEIPQLLINGRFKQASELCAYYKQIFGDDFYIELQRFPARSHDVTSELLKELAYADGISLVATNNVHYTEPEGYEIKELLNAISDIEPAYTPRAGRSAERYLKDEVEMSSLFSDVPEAIDNTQVITDKCNLKLELGKPRFPGFEIPKNETYRSYLLRVTSQGLKRLYPHTTREIKERLEYELDTIHTLGFDSYFLVVWDIVRFARSRDIRLIARGSAVDSLVVYLLGISNVDPIEYDLLFERFMHPLRREPPDIDLDIDRKRRPEVRDYIYKKYGANNVACVGTINTYMARGALRDAGKALGYPKELVSEACSGIHFLSVSKLAEKVDKRPELKDSPVYCTPGIPELIKLCIRIDGFPKHMSVHLGGLLIGDGNLSDLMPLERSSGGDIISQYDKNDVERLGIVKMDLLALPTLTVIEDTITKVKWNRGIEINIENIPRDDKAVYHMLQEGKTLGTFQLESPAQREMAGRLLPNCFEDIIVSISLVRPGPLKSNMDKSYLLRRHGQEPVRYDHPLMMKALKESLGVILYQEQVLKVAHDLAGLSYADADGFRRAMTHDRTQQEMEKMRVSFIESAEKNGVNHKTAEGVFEQLAAFAAYGFCKAHAVAYATVAYQTLWLKCHYPAEYLASLLSNLPMGYYPARVLVAEARRFGVKVLGLDINHSFNEYTVENNAIRVGLRQLKGISVSEIDQIITERKRGPFTSVDDFMRRCHINRPSLENIAKVGGFDSLTSQPEPDSILSGFPLTNCGKKKHNNDDLLPGAITTDDNLQKLKYERELLGLDLSAHPLDFINLKGITRMSELKELSIGKEVTIVGSVIRYQTPPTRNRKRVMFIILEDGTGVADVTVFDDIQSKYGSLLFREGWLKVRGKIQKRGPKSLSIIASRLESINNLTTAK
jgi:error-prone DNA polymerase